MRIGIPLPKEALPHTAMFFTAYAYNIENGDLTQNYKDFVVPTIFENVNYTENKIWQTSQSGANPLGDYSLVIDMRTTLFYRNIRGEKVYIKYLEPLAFASKGIDEQSEKYFTVQQQTSTFVIGIIDMYKNEIKVSKKDVSSANLKKLGFVNHTITNIDTGGFGKDIDIITLTGKI